MFRDGDDVVLQSRSGKELGRYFPELVESLRDELAPVATTDDLLTVVQWPRGRGTVLVVGHQPALGQAAARLLGMAAPDCSIRKGAVWWLRQRERQGASETVLLAVQSPDLL